VRLLTERLVLVPCIPELAHALQKDRGRAAEILGATLPDGWPDEELAGLLSIISPSEVEFAVWIAIADGVVVGSAGFHGEPRDGVVELGFGIHEPYRNTGYATEASSALIAWALEQPQVNEVVSECDASNTPSMRVLEKIGMARTGKRDNALLWSYS